MKPKTPIEMMMDGCTWVPIEGGGEAQEGDIPHVIHRGILTIDTLSMEVFQLSDGQRIISQDGMAAFLRWLNGEAE